MSASASDLLRELEERPKRDLLDNAPILWNALPEIRAVVEAAERLYADIATSAPVFDGIDAALTALTEKLKGAGA